MNRLLLALCVAAALVFGASAAHAESFVLHSHENGGASPPEYGLRLDGLYSGDTSDIFTFDFDHTYADMRLTVSGGKIVISGTAYGGLNAGSGYSTSDTSKVGVWEIYFEYTDFSSVTDGWEADENANNNGWIRRVGDANGDDLSGGAEDAFDLVDEAGDHTYSFRFLDVVHRNDGPWSGWGWLNHDYNRDGTMDSHIYASDWLFTATPVPEPGTLALLGMSLLGFAAVRRRRARTA